VCSDVVLGALWNLPVKIRAQKLASLPAPFNKVRTSKSETPPLDTAPSSARASSTSLKWTPMKIDGDKRQTADDVATPSAGISVLKQDKLDSSTSLLSIDALTSMTSNTDKQIMNDVDINDIENSLSDVSRRTCIATA